MIAAKPRLQNFATSHQLSCEPTQYARMLRYGMQPLDLVDASGRVVASIEPVEHLSLIPDASQVTPFWVFTRKIPEYLAIGRPVVLTYHTKVMAIFKPCGVVK